MIVVNRLRPYALQLSALAVLWVGFALSTPMFVGTGAVYAVLQNFALLGLVSVGMCVTVIAGELDLSVASVAVMAGVVSIKMGGAGLVPAIVAGAVVGVLIGIVQGTLIAKLLVNSLVFTIASQIAIRGFAFMVAGNGPVSLENLAVSDPMLTTWWVLAPDTVIALVVFAAAGFYLTYTRPGRELYAVGGGRKEAAAAGVNVRRTIVIAFAISGGCAALAGSLASMKSGGISPESYANLMLTAPAAILIGGFSLNGGKGNVVNVILGVAILSVLTVGLGARGVQSYMVDLFVGALLLVVVIGNFAVERWLPAMRHRPELHKVEAM